MHSKVKPSSCLTNTWPIKLWPARETHGYIFHPSPSLNHPSSRWGKESGVKSAQSLDFEIFFSKIAPHLDRPPKDYIDPALRLAPRSIAIRLGIPQFTAGVYVPGRAQNQQWSEIAGMSGLGKFAVRERERRALLLLETCTFLTTQQLFDPIAPIPSH